MYDLLLHCGRKNFCHYCLHTFTTEEILKRDIKDCFKINAKQTIKMPKKGEYVKFKTFERKIKPPLMIHANFKSILVPEDNGKQNTNKSYTNKYQKHVAGIYGYVLACILPQVQPAGLNDRSKGDNGDVPRLCRLGFYPWPVLPKRTGLVPPGNG